MDGSNALSARMGRPPLPVDAPRAPAPTATAGGEALSANRLGAVDSSSIESVRAIAASVSPLLLALPVPELLQETAPPHDEADALASADVGPRPTAPGIARTL
jgi:hypothetical protein